MHFAENSFQGFDHRLLAVEVQRTHFVPRVAVQQVHATYQAILILAKAEDLLLDDRTSRSRAGGPDRRRRARGPARRP